jgi:hypothetical protein
MDPNEKYKQERSKILKYETKFDVEKWYPLIKEETFKSEIFDFSVDEANAFVDFYRKTLNKKERQTIENYEILVKLEKKLDASIQKMLKNTNSNCTGVFVRLGPRR